LSRTVVPPPHQGRFSLSRSKELEAGHAVNAGRNTSGAGGSYPDTREGMPVIMTKPEEIETWMTAPAEEGLSYSVCCPTAA
jgi:hypothetical protein